jgi:hypothetical protein
MARNAPFPAGNSTFYCLEDYKPIGRPIRQASIPNAEQLTAGQVARQCGGFCDLDPACHGFRAVGKEALHGPECLLLEITAAGLASSLVFPPGRDFPPVLDNITAADGIELRSLAWMCFKETALWNDFGLASHAPILSSGMPGRAY